MTPDEMRKRSTTLETPISTMWLAQAENAERLDSVIAILETSDNAFQARNVGLTEAWWKGYGTGSTDTRDLEKRGIDVKSDGEILTLKHPREECPETWPNDKRFVCGKRASDVDGSVWFCSEHVPTGEK